MKNTLGRVHRHRRVIGRPEGPKDPKGPYPFKKGGALIVVLVMIQKRIKAHSNIEYMVSELKAHKAIVRDKKKHV